MVDPFTAADPLYRRAQALGNRHVPLITTSPNFGGLFKTLGWIAAIAFATGVFITWI